MPLSIRGVLYLSRPLRSREAVRLLSPGRWQRDDRCFRFHFRFFVPSGHFVVNNATGVISTAKPLDYENITAYVLRVQADSMAIAMSSFNVASKSKPPVHIHLSYETQ